MPRPFRYVTPVARNSATGLVADVYAQVATDFGMPARPVFLTLSRATDVPAATWAALRESLVTGAVPRPCKEVVAAAVSWSNRCPFCVDAHTAILDAVGASRLADDIYRGEKPADGEHALLADWAKAGDDAGAQGSPASRSPVITPMSTSALR